MKCLSLLSANIAQNLRWHWKTNTGQKSLSFLGPKKWSKINPTIKNIKTSSSFMHTLKKNVLLQLQT